MEAYAANSLHCISKYKAEISTRKKKAKET